MRPPEIDQIAEIMLTNYDVVDDDLAIRIFNRWVEANASPAYAGNDSLQLMTFINRSLREKLGLPRIQSDEYP